MHTPTDKPLLLKLLLEHSKMTLLSIKWCFITTGVVDKKYRGKREAKFLPSPKSCREN